MRILHVIPSLAARDGGPSKAAVEMCRELIRRGEHAEIYTTNAEGEGCLDVPLGRPIDVRGVGVTYFPIDGGHYYKFSRSMAAALRANVPRYDVVEINSLYQFPSTIAAHYCRKYGVPYVLRPHGTLDPYLYRRHPLRKRVYEVLVERRNLANAAAVHFTTAEEMELAKATGFGLKGVIVPLGVVPEKPGGEEAAEEFRVKWPQTRGKRMVLFLGRLNFKKGLDLLARALGEVCRQRDDVHLFIAGPDDEGYGTQVRRWLEDEAVLGRATFSGMILGREKAAALAAADVFVLPSYSENFGIAVVEALAAGLPVVISNRVNIWREVALAGAGIVINCDVAELTRALLEVLDNRAMRQEMGEAGRRLAREKFSWQTAGDQLVRLYHEVVAGRSPASATGMPSALAR